jgi:hypothetical protein
MNGYEKLSEMSLKIDRMTTESWLGNRKYIQSMLLLRVQLSFSDNSVTFQFTESK